MGEVIIWGALTIVLVIVEVLTVQLVSVWFAAGAMAALVAALFDGGPILQVVLFLAVSLAAFIITRPLVKKRINEKRIPTNTDALPGRRCLVLQEVTDSGGRVTVDNQDWAARCVQGQAYPAGTHCIITAIQGVTLLVEKESEE